MVVHENHGGCAANYRNPEHLARMHEDRVERAYGHKLVSPHPASSIQEQHNEALTLWVEILMRRDMQPPVVGSLIRCLAYQHGFRHRTIPQSNNLEFLRSGVTHAVLRVSRCFASTCHFINWR